MRGPYWKKASVSARARRSRDRIAERAIRGLRNSRSVTSRCANFPRACFLRGYAGESEATRDRIAGGAVLEKKGQPSAPCGGPYWKKASVSARAKVARHPDLSRGLQIPYYPSQSVYQRLGQAIFTFSTFELNCGKAEWPFLDKTAIGGLPGLDKTAIGFDKAAIALAKTALGFDMPLDWPALIKRPLGLAGLCRQAKIFLATMPKAARWPFYQGL